MGHLPFEQAEMKLGELLHIYVQFDKVNWVLLEKEASDNGWKTRFKKTKHLLKCFIQNYFVLLTLLNFPIGCHILFLRRRLLKKKLGKKYGVHDTLLKID